jgi:hypothetical protein
MKVVGKDGFGVVLHVVHRPSMKILPDKVVNPTPVDPSSRAEIHLIREVGLPYMAAG